MDKMKRNAGNLLMCLAEIVIGILLLINPVGFTAGIIITIGFLLAVLGIVSIIGYFRTAPEEAALKNELAIGLVAVSAALVCIFKTGWFIAAFPLITVFYGVLILLSGINKIQWTVDMLRLKQKYWFVALIGTALSVLFAVLVLANPFSSTIILWNFIAVSLIIEAIVDILAFIFGMKRK
ncbi:MAG: DUF308 domain-containing protein [Lachnospiraceae bacterium]|nr:DUF308 domain-containing protein [Muribaculaceae bacterium]MCM1412310.1 DUF308 domain-containing protein [Lachnospiraceae bacterium]